MLSKVNYLKITKIVAETTEAKTYFFRPRQKFSYRAGQFIDLYFSHDDTSRRRSYSLSSNPEDRQYSVTIKRVTDGRFSNLMADRILVGNHLAFAGPFGEFTDPVPEASGQPLIAFAAGSGITPIYSIMKSRLNRGKANLLLCYSNQNDETTIFQRSLVNLTQKDGLDLISFDKSKGNRLYPGAIEELVQTRESFVRNAYFLICGPVSYRVMIQDTLSRLGIEKNRIHFESFGDVARVGQSVKSLNKIAKKPLPKDARAASIRFATQTGTKVVESFKGESLLDAGLRAGVPIMHSCKSGICGLCKLTCNGGSLVDEDGTNASGEFLSCRMFPSTSEVNIG